MTMQEIKLPNLYQITWNIPAMTASAVSAMAIRAIFACAFSLVTLFGLSKPAFASDSEHVEFLAMFRRLALKQSLKMEDVSNLTGWKFKSKFAFPEVDRLDYYWIAQVDGTSFEVSASGSPNTGYMFIRAVLPKPPFCVRKDAMIGSYGANFRKAVVNIENYPDEASLSPEVLSNIEYLGWAPFYPFTTGGLKSNVSFDFFFNACASAISVQRNPG